MNLCFQRPPTNPGSPVLHSGTKWFIAEHKKSIQQLERLKNMIGELRRWIDVIHERGEVNSVRLELVSAPRSCTGSLSRRTCSAHSTTCASTWTAFRDGFVNCTVGTTTTTCRSRGSRTNSGSGKRTVESYRWATVGSITDQSCYSQCPSQPWYSPPYITLLASYLRQVELEELKSKYGSLQKDHAHMKDAYIDVHVVTQECDHEQVALRREVGFATRFCLTRLLTPLYQTHC